MRRISRLSRSVVSGMNRHLYRLISLGSNAGCSGQDLIEYALLVGFVAVAIAATVPFAVTAPISLIFTKIHNFLVSRANG